jgi:hypothetical protein
VIFETIFKHSFIKIDPTAAKPPFASNFQPFPPAASKIQSHIVPTQAKERRNEGFVLSEPGLYSLTRTSVPGLKGFIK